LICLSVGRFLLRKENLFDGAHDDQGEFTVVFGDVLEALN
jgi:hypothetical protein